MSNVSENVIQSMFNHLIASYSEDEAREILVQKYPAQKGDIYSMGKLVKSAKTAAVEQEGEDGDAEVEVEEVETNTEKLAKAVKAKTAKPAKAAAAPKDKKVSKMDQARELYANATDKSRKAMIEVFGKELGLSAAAASTYFYNVKS